MSRADYEHWNEERDQVWWQEEGQHYGHEDPPDPDEEQYEIRTRYPFAPRQTRESMSDAWCIDCDLPVWEHGGHWLDDTDNHHDRHRVGPPK